MNAIFRAGMLIVVFALGGCASAAVTTAMVAVPSTPVHKSASGVSIAVSGGRPTSMFYTSQISNEGFGDALAKSVVDAGLFSHASVTEGEHYRLTAYIGNVQRPFFAASVPIVMEVGYTLTDMQTNQNVWTKNVVSNYTAPWNAAFLGVERWRLGIEGAAQANIRQMMESVSELKLP